MFLAIKLGQIREGKKVVMQQTFPPVTPAISKSIKNIFIKFRESTTADKYMTFSERTLCDQVHPRSVHGFFKVLGLLFLARAPSIASEGPSRRPRHCCQVTPATAWTWAAHPKWASAGGAPAHWARVPRGSWAAQPRSESPGTGSRLLSCQAWVLSHLDDKTGII